MGISEDIVLSISTAEMRVLQVLWDESPLAAHEIVERLKNEGSSHPKTIKTLINRLLKKKAVNYEERNRKYYYSALVNRADFNKYKANSFLEKFFGGQLTPLISLFSEENKLSDKDLAELKKLIERFEEGKDD